MKRRGSAIIIAMLLIAAVGGIAFGIGRVYLLEAASSGVYESGVGAYYAAESGIEEGFLRYRYSQNVEVPFIGWTLNSDKVFSKDITDNVSKTGAAATNYDGVALGSYVTDAAKQYYDLRVGHAGSYDGNTNVPTFALSSSYLPVARDNSLRLDLTGLVLSRGTTDSLLFKIKFKSIPDVGGDGWGNVEYCKALSEIKFTVKNVSGTKEYKSLLNYNPALCAPLISIKSEKLDLPSTYTTPNAWEIEISVADLRNIFVLAGASYPQLTDSVSLSIKPLYYDAEVFIAKQECVDDAANCSSKSTAISGPNSRITSTGYYGDATRKLQADIDRQSGSLYDLYDYVLYIQE